MNLLDSKAVGIFQIEITGPIQYLKNIKSLS